MKIYYLANVRIPTEKAHGVHIMKMCEALANNGAQVELIVSRRHGTEDPYKYFGVQKNFQLKVIPGLPTIGWGWIGYWLNFTSFMLLVNLYLLWKKLVDRQKTVIYTRGDPILLLFALEKFCYPVFWETHIKPTSLANWYFWCSARANGLVAVTDYYRQELERLPGLADKVIFAPDGVDLRVFEATEAVNDLRHELNLPNDRKIIAYVGKYKTMNYDKGVSGLIDAFAELRKKMPQAFLTLIGLNQDEIDEVEQLFSGHGIPSGDYRLVAHLPHSEAMRYLRAADVLVMNYPNIAHYAHYMSPLKLFEYMGSGKAIVASDLPSIREILNEQNALLVKADNLLSLVDGLEKMVGDEQLAAKIGAQAKLDAKQYSWDERAKKILNFIRQKTV